MTVLAPAIALDRPPSAAVTTLEAAYAAHHARAVRLAYLLTGDRHAAEDAVADVWVKVHQRLERGPVDDVGAYVRRAVVNQVNSRFRRLGLVRREAAKRSGDDRGQQAFDQGVADRDQVLAALAKLPPRTRAVVALRFYEDLSVADTAAALGISEGAVKSTTNRGLAALRQYLEVQR
jgi:RNA polymerase sigma-70 factor (sigma-E family)